MSLTHATDTSLALADCFAIMSGGTIGRCAVEIPRGHCTCCLFDTGLDNWIGLFEGEYAELERRGTVADWEAVRDGMGLRCGRQRRAEVEARPFACSNKPLDCAFYPFYPAGVARDATTDGYRIELAAGAPKCPIVSAGTSNVRDLIDQPRNSEEAHAIRVAACAVRLAEAGQQARIEELLAGYVAYGRRITVLLPAADYAALLQHRPQD